MPTPESSLSVAIQSTADFLASQFVEDVVVTVDSPQKAQEQAKESTEHVLNLFVYRIAPSGFHAQEADDEVFFVRANILLTAFPAGQGTASSDADLRVLGHAIRVLHSVPVIPDVLPGVLPAAADAGDFRNAPATQYRLQSVFQAPSMEELNHIWTTQGGELAYRLSVAYELALIPIEPLSHALPAPDVLAAELVLAPGAGARPFQMFRQAGRLFSHLQIPPATASTSVALTGIPDSTVAVQVQWLRAGGVVQRQAAQLFTIQTSDVDSNLASIDVILDSAASGDTAALLATPVSASGEAIAGASPANVIELEVAP